MDRWEIQGGLCELILNCRKHPLKYLVISLFHFYPALCLQLDFDVDPRTTMTQHTDVQRTLYLAAQWSIRRCHIVFVNQKHTHSIRSSMQKSQMGSGTGRIIVFLACDPGSLDIISDHYDLCCSPWGRCGLYVDVITARLPRHRRRLVCTRAPLGTQASCSLAVTLQTTHF